MSAALQRRPMTRQDFLAWDETQTSRFEYDGFGPVAMVGGTMAHDLIAGNLFALLWQALRGKPCRPHTSNVRIQTGAGTVRYPDAMVSCSEMAATDTWGRNPVVVFEVLSPSTSSVDLVDKNSEYRATASIQRFVMLNQDRVAALVFARAAGAWVGSVLDGAAASLDMPEIGVSLLLGDLYEGVMLDQPAPS